MLQSKVFVFIALLLSIVVLAIIFPQRTYAQTCTSGRISYIISCDDSTGQCKPSNVYVGDAECTLRGGTCQKQIPDRICGYNQLGFCDVIGNTYDWISCSTDTGSGGGGSYCPEGYQPVTSCKKNCVKKQRVGSCSPAKDGTPRYQCKECQLVACNATEPTNLSVTRLSATQATITWTPGANGTSQKIYVGSNQASVEANCPQGVGSGTGCVEMDTSLDKAANSYTTGNTLMPGTVYYWRIVTYKSTVCYKNSATATSISSCELVPSSASVNLGETQTVNLSVTSSSDITNTTFSGDSALIGISPDSDTTYQYGTEITGNGLTFPGSTPLTGSVYINGILACTSTADITVLNPGPWWQVQDADLSSSGSLRSSVPSGEYFGLAGDGGYPGVPAYSGTTNISTTNASELGWVAESTFLGTKTYDSRYFFNQIPDDTVVTNITDSEIDGSFFGSGGIQSYGYYWYRYDGSTSGVDLTITGSTDIADRKVILLVDSADLNIASTINLLDGEGFFMAVVGKTAGGSKGNIVIDPTIGGSGDYDLEGIYVADGKVSTGVSDQQLMIRGSVAGYEGVVLERDLESGGGGFGNSIPAEFFAFAPDQILLFPSKLGVRRISWKEVAP